MSQQPIVLAGRYRVEEELGRGGMARVYRGTDTVLGRPVAIKVLAPQFAEDADFVGRFRREAQAAARLNHPNLVSVYDTGSDKGTHFIVMEFVDGRTLADFLSGGARVLPSRAIEIADLVLRALQAAHAQGVVHRDIKPANIMITTNGGVKVTDFGIARVSSSGETLAATSTVLGTASYLSPEQARSAVVDERADLYALGCVLYEMVTGRPPFTGDSAVSVASKHVLEMPVPPSRINPEVTRDLDAVILRALEKDPNDRYASAQDLRRDLGKVLRGDPLDGPARGSVERVPDVDVVARRPRAERRGAGALASLFGGGGGGGGRNWAQIVVVGLTVVGFVGGLFLFARALLGPRVDEVVVPSVLELPLEQARAVLENEGLTVAAVTVDVEDATKEPGTVLEQDPAAGETVAQGAEVTLTVSVLPSTVTVPSVAGLDEVQATAVLRNAGFIVLTRTEDSDTVEAGLVVRTDPGEGSAQPYGSTVTLVLSNGLGTVVVPDVRCQTFGAAAAALRELGLNPVISDTAVEPNPICPNPSRVAAQDPPAGTETQTGTTVTLSSSGAAGTPSPSPLPSL